jgi:hypothetical protein
LNCQSLAVFDGEIFSPLTILAPSASVRISKKQLSRGNLATYGNHFRQRTDFIASKTKVA